MKNFFKLIICQAAIVAAISWGLTACYTDTVDSFSSFRVQFPLFFHTQFYDKAAPDTSVSFANLYKYDEFRTNKDKIDQAEIYQFNYRVDSLVLENHKPFDPLTDNVVFDFIRFYVQFAVPKTPEIAARMASLAPNDEFCLDSANWKPDLNSEITLLGEFTNVNVADYYLTSKQIQKVEAKVTEIITEIAKNRPQFYIVTMYSKVAGQTEPKRKFPLIYAYYDMFLRLKVSI